MKLDDTNREIIRKLSDGRKPYSVIADEIGVTENTVRARANRMIEEGVLDISGLVNPQKVPDMQVIIMGIKLSTLDLEKKAEEFYHLKGVVSVQIVTGRYDLIVQLVTSSSDGPDLLNFFRNELSKIRDVSDAETFVVYHSCGYRIPYVL
ncbi:MAG: Lrp/AsnC family transcriptional regulator [Sphaerochaetaceae bacterium]|nr:Lrp/AsnC family transcriptional regulator [Sphaerochaetaceae bacterium]